MVVEECKLCVYSGTIHVYIIYPSFPSSPKLNIHLPILSLMPEGKAGFDTFVWLVAWSICKERNNKRDHDKETLMLVALASAIEGRPRSGLERASFLLLAF